MMLSVLCIIAALFVVSQGQATVEVGVACLVGDSLATNVIGHVYFVTVDSHDVWVWANISGIPEGTSTRGLHIHEFGDITGPTALNVGSHYQGAFTSANVHGCEFNTTRHEGDMGNWNVTDGSILPQSKTISMISLFGGYSVIGRAVVLHNETDNCVNITSAGSRLAQGVIGIANTTFLPDEVAAKVGALTAANNAVSGFGSTVASALLTPTLGNSVNGFVTFTQDTNGLTVKAKIYGLNSNNAYGFHIHIYGDLSSADGNAAGSHYNPYNASHGLAPNRTRHVGDLGNICTYGSDGYAYYSYTFTDGLISLSGNTSIIGRSVIIHAIRDDGGSVFGSRIAQGVIGGFNVTNDITIPAGVTPNPPSCDSFAPPPFVPEIGVAQLVGDSYDSTVTGYVYFVTLNSSYVWVWANISGITCHTEDLPHGLHVHTFGDVTDLQFGNNVGSHYIGSGQSVHGCEDTLNRHEGDMGNWTASMGSIYQSKTLNLLALTGGYSIIGRAVILHNDTDNCVEVASAGNRLAQGVIGIANPSYLPAEVAAVARNPTFNNATNGATVPKAVAHLTPISGSSVRGLVTFEQVDNTVVVKAGFVGLNSTSAYGFHIHIYGDLSSDDGLAASSHYNPYNSSHGLAPSPTRHVGDLGNICTYDSDGTAYYSYNFTDLVLLSGSNNIIGRNVIIHSIRDDGGLSYGTRIAQGVIGIANETATTTTVTFPPDLVFAAPSCQNYATYTNAPEVGVVRLVGDSLDKTISGYIYFVTLNSSYVYVWANVSGITSLPDQPHGLHVHTLGDITDPTGQFVGSHYLGVYGYNIHSCEGTVPRHQGDMGNWTVSGGLISQSKTVDLLAQSGSFSIIGRSVILHNMSDDCQTTASAGGRLAQGVIGIANPAYLPAQVAAIAGNPTTNNAAYGPDSSVPIALAVLTPISGSSITGLVTFEQTDNKVLVKASVKGLNISNAYGFHIHTYGDLNSTDGMTASSHYNPYNASHSLPTNKTRHVGDLGNICSFGADGTAYYSYTFSDLLTLYGPNNIMGRNVIIHAIRDDGGSVYGDRIAQGVIGLGSTSTSIAIPTGVSIHPPSCAPVIPPATTGAGSGTTGATTGKSTSTTGSGTSDKGSGGMSAAGKAFLAIFIIALVGGLIVAGYFYQKNGHLFGYALSKKGVRPVRADDYVAFTEN